jgi:hypothetical protein
MSYVKNPIEYISNVSKEYGEWRKAQPKSADGKAMPEAGQAWGALLQGRRYDTNGKQITGTITQKINKIKR